MTADGRQPPCDYGDRLCGITKLKPILLWPANQIIVNLWREITDLSESDSNGLPTMARLEFVFNSKRDRLHRSDYELMMLKLRLIHKQMRTAIASSIARNRASQTKK